MKLNQGQINKLMRRGYELQARIAGVSPGEFLRVDTDSKGKEIPVFRKRHVDRDKYSRVKREPPPPSGPLFDDPVKS